MVDVTDSAHLGAPVASICPWATPEIQGQVRRVLSHLSAALVPAPRVMQDGSIGTSLVLVRRGRMVWACLDDDGDRYVITQDGGVVDAWEPDEDEPDPIGALCARMVGEWRAP